jgi:formylglycine-generating enzyme
MLQLRFIGLLALVLAACHYDPIVPEGVAACRTNADCPATYDCRPKPGTKISVCCKTALCGFTEDEPTPDAAPPARDSAAPDKPLSPDLREAGPADVSASDLPADAAEDGPAADLAADVGPDLVVPVDLPPDLPPDTGPGCPAAKGGPALVRAGDFCIDATEVTNQQYATFLMDKGTDVSGQPAACKWNTSYIPSIEGVVWPFLKGRENFPVANVDWCDAFMFCQWAGKRLCGKIGGGRLPNVAAAASVTGQWFNACTNGGRLTYPYGMNFQRATCNIDAPTNAAMFVEEVKHRSGCEGGYPGLFDMGGNMEEWTDACDKDGARDDSCAIAGSTAYSGDLTPDDLSCHGSVFGQRRDTRYYMLGFRCCAD